MKRRCRKLSDNGNNGDVFGSPDADDGTARFDRVAGMARTEFMRQVGDGSRILNRPIGSKVLNPTERKEDYNLLYKGNANKLGEALENYITQAQGNEIVGALNWTNWILDMEKGGD